MPKTSADPTNAANLEARFDAGEEILDFFDLNSARVVSAPLNSFAGKRMRASGRTPSVMQLKRAVWIAERIGKLEKELGSLLVGKNG